jgi:hypothetical protein
MKTLKLYGTLLLLAALPLIFTACSDKDEVNYEENEPIVWIRLSTDQFGLDPNAAILHVTAEVNNVPLRAEIISGSSWITSCQLVEQEQGGTSRKDGYLLTVEANDTYAKRKGEVCFIAGTNEDNLVKESVFISQEMTNNH